MAVIVSPFVVVSDVPELTYVNQFQSGLTCTSEKNGIIIYSTITAEVVVESGNAHLTSTDPSQELLEAFGLSHSALVENTPAVPISLKPLVLSKLSFVNSIPAFGIKFKFGMSFACKY